MTTNLKGLFSMSKLGVKHMLKARKGSIINLSSVVGQTGKCRSGQLLRLKKADSSHSPRVSPAKLRREISPSMHCPSYIETDMTDAISAEFKTTLLANIPLGRLGSVNDIAQAALYLASEGATYLTGQVLAVNGGHVQV